MTDRRRVRELHHELLARDPEAPGRGQVVDEARRRWPLLSGRDHEDLVGGVLARFHGLGRLDPLLADPSVRDVLVNGPGPVWVDRGGLERTDVELDRDDVELIVERIVGPLGLRVDRHSPIVDARLPDGSRVTISVAPVAVDGPVLAIRRFAASAFPLESFGRVRADDLVAAVVGRQNIVVSGATGVGKTSLLNALVAHIGPDERILTVEDVAELRLPHRHVVRFEARSATADGVGAVTIRDLVRNALRLRPDRIVVGEVRGPEALDLLWAMNSGHDGSLSTVHANSAADALRRLETMVLEAAVGLPHAVVAEHLRAALHLVVHLGRGPGGAPEVAEILRVAAGDGDRADEGPGAVPRVDPRHQGANS